MDVITSMAYSSSQGLLATSSETGVVALYDFNAPNQTLRAMKADAAGVNQIKFDRKGQILTVGNSCGHLKVWDVRSGATVAWRGLPQRGVSLTSVLPHPVTDTVFCGTSDGSVVAWDLRTSQKCLHQEKLHSSEVTSLTVHPSVRGRVLSGGGDGQIMDTDFSEEVK